jgi:Bacterial membrane protein YfhO
LTPAPDGTTRVRRPGAALLYPGLLVLCVVLLFAGPVRDGRVTLPLDILGTAYPWSEQATDVFHVAYPDNPPQNPLIKDLLSIDTPWYVFAREELRQGRLPLWDPFQAGGMPLAANDESAVFYLPQLIAFLLPVAAGLQALMVFHKLVVGLGMYLLLRSIGLRRSAACLGAIVLMLSGFYTVWLGYPQSAVAVWLPWSLLCVEKLIASERRRRAWAAGLAVVTGLQLTGGHVETSAHVLLATAFYAVFRACARAPRRPPGVAGGRAGLRSAAGPVWVGLGLALGIALAAVQLGPTIQYLRESYTNVARNEGRPERPQPLPNLVFWLVPNLAGNPAYPEPKPFPDRSIVDTEYFNYNERTGYVGVGAIMLALVGLARPDRFFVAHRWLFGALLVLAACLAYGVFPIYPLAVALPVLRTINHNRVLFVIALGAAALAGIGFDWLASEWRAFAGPTSGRPGPARRYVGALLVVVALAGVLGATFVPNQGLMAMVRWLSDVSPSGALGGGAWTRSWVMLALVLLVASLALLWCTLDGVVEPRPGRTALALLLVADLMLVAAHYAPRVPTNQLYPPVAVTDALASLGPGARFVAGQSGQTSMPPNTSTVYRLRDLNVYDGIVAKRAHEFMDWVDRFGPAYDTSTLLLANLAPDYHALALASVTHVLMPTSDVEPAETDSHLVYQRESGEADQRLGSIATVASQGQGFESNTDDLSAVGLYYYRDRSFVAPVMVRVQDPDGRVVRERQVNTVWLNERGWLVVSFPPIERARGARFVVTLAARPDVPSVGSFGLYGDPGASVAGGRRYEGGRPVAGALRFRLYRSTASAGVHPVWSDSSHSIYALDGARPRAYVADGVVVARDGAEALAALGGLRVPGADAVVEGAPPLTSAGGTATLVRDEPGDVVVEVDAPAAGVLVLSEGYGDGGWQVDVDGRGQSPLHANHLFLGAAVPAGHHVVHFRYWPQSLTLGIAVSASALVVVLALVAVRRRPGEAPRRRPQAGENTAGASGSTEAARGRRAVTP